MRPPDIRYLVFAGRYDQFRTWCKQNNVDYRKFTYIANEPMIHGYDPETTKVIVLGGLDKEEWKYHAIDMMRALGFEIRYDT